jgi:hypothetical protein
MREAIAMFQGFRSDPTGLQSGRIDALRSIWEAKKDGRPLPSQRDFSPVELKAFLPDLMLVDIGHAPLRVRYRLVGTWVARMSRLDFTGRYLDELDFNNPGVSWIDAYRMLVETAAPVFGVVPVALFDGLVGDYDVAIFPLAQDGRHVDRALAIEDYGRLRHLHEDQIHSTGIVERQGDMEAVQRFLAVRP